MRTKVTVEVDGRRWRQVLTLETSRPHDLHYVLETDDGGRTILVFGDGEHGARLPASTRGVTVTYSSSKMYSGVKLTQGPVVLDDDWNQQPEAPTRYCCLYRGEVVGNEGPAARMRLKVQVPQVLGHQTVWAMPCTPVGGSAVPPVGAIVWVMFEEGDLSRPVWMGTMGGDQG